MPRSARRTSTTTQLRTRQDAVQPEHRHMMLRVPIIPSRYAQCITCSPDASGDVDNLHNPEVVLQYVSTGIHGASLRCRRVVLGIGDPERIVAERVSAQPPDRFEGHALCIRAAAASRMAHSTESGCC